MKPADMLRADPGQLTAALAEAGVSISELARTVKVSRPAVRKWQTSRVPPHRLSAVCAALEDAPALVPTPAGALEQLAAVVAADPGLTEARFQVRTRHLAVYWDAAEQAGVFHRELVTRQDATGRCYSSTVVLPGLAAATAKPPAGLTGHDVEGLRHLYGWSQEGLGKRLGVTRQRVADLERSGVPDGRREQLHQLLVERLADLDLVAARQRAGLSQAELARRLGKSPAAVNLWERSGRPLPLAAAVSAGHVLAAAAKDDPVEQAAERVVTLVAAAEPDGLTEADLVRQLGRGRQRGPGPAEYDQPALERAVRRKQVHWRQTWLRDTNGAWKESRRLHSGPRRRLDDEETMTGATLSRARREAGVSQSQLADGLGTVWGTVSKWERRGKRPIPPVVTAVVHDVLAQLAATRPDPRAQARTQVLAAATATPGATRRQILVEAGYGRANPTALQALEDLVATGELHLRSTPSRAGGSHLGVHPGPASQDAQPTALPGEELRRGRLAVSLKQHELAALVGVTQTAVGQWERSTVPAYRTGDVLKALATASIPEIMALPAITAQQLRRARQEAGISQEALGEALGVTGPAVSRWERVGVPRNRETAVNLALSGAPARAQRTFPRTRGASGARAQHTV